MNEEDKCICGEEGESPRASVYTHLQFVWAMKQNQRQQKHTHAHQTSGYRQLPCLLHILQYLSAELAKVVLFGSGVAVALRLISVFADLKANSCPN
jgi:hypothetical protein